MKFSRRDLLVWSAGAAAGLALTPVPWKLLDDTSIWSQNWPWIPQPTRGPVDVKLSSCTLCPNGCGLRVRLANGCPVGIAGMATHPLTQGALCPLAFGAHQLNWHPLRLRSVRHRGVDSSFEEAHSAFVKACAEGPVVIVDGLPGRAASAVLESFAAKRGEYRVVRGPETRALASYQKWSGVPAAALGYDLENARTILSFGAPLLDGWGIPGRFTRRWAQSSGNDDPEVRLIQVESSLSRTAARAWQWCAIQPGSDAALATGIARVLIEERLVAARGPVPAMALVDAASQTGLEANAIRELARAIVAHAPVVAIASDHNPSVAALNVVLGSVGASGGIVQRSTSGRSTASAEGAFASARAVLIDSTVPWEFVPETSAEVFRFAAWDGGSNKADWLLPAPGFLEELTDIPTAPTSGIETYAIAPALAKASHTTHSGWQFLVAVDPSLSTPDKIIHSRCAELFRNRKGTLHATEETPLVKIASAEKLEEQLSQGAIWTGDATRPSLRCSLKEWPAEVVSQAGHGFPIEWSPPVMPPLASKLYEESNLRGMTQGRTA